ncbi:MAG TPA: TRAP transporter small permease subunit [Alphaproteobacteria bacterium]|nr:TRAP transporter small permease subunit [Alphaproteobacteria bacterium]
MASTLIAAGQWLRRRAENIAAAMLATMFIAFLVQIVFRYVLNWPAGWAFELSILCWLWGVLWGAAFIVDERDEIRFDVIYGAVRPRVRRVFVVITGLALLAIYGMSLPAVADYVAFMKVERSAYLKIHFNWLYSIYVVFAVAVLVRYAWLVWRAVRGGGTPSAGAGEARSS